MPMGPVRLGFAYSVASEARRIYGGSVPIEKGLPEYACRRGKDRCEWALVWAPACRFSRAKLAVLRPVTYLLGLSPVRIREGLLLQHLFLSDEEWIAPSE